MAELCLSNTSKSQFPRLIFSDFALFCSFLFSHPLYFSYFIFFSPYLLKLLSFLSPLFVTTSLLLLALIFHNSTPKLSEPGPSFLLSTFHAIIDRLRPKVGHEFHGFEEEEFEAYKIVFLFEEEDPSTFDLIQSPVEVSEFKPRENCLQALDQVLAPNLAASLEEDPCKAAAAAAVETSKNLSLMEEKKVEDFLLREFNSNAEEKKILLHDNPPGAKSNKVVKEREGVSKLRCGSEAKDIINVRVCDNGGGGGGEYTKKVMLHAAAATKLLGQNVNGSSTISNGAEYKSNFERLGTNLGSMRKEKEWKRTLACKLFEERHNAAVEGDEGMDSLWETYESDSSNKSKKKDDDAAAAATEKKKMMMMKKKNSSSSRSGIIDYYGDEEIDDEDEELEMTNGRQLCCLQAFKFSAGKMNLGMGRPNLVKISKALKGIGWLHHVKRHSKKETS